MHVLVCFFEKSIIMVCRVRVIQKQQKYNLENNMKSKNSLRAFRLGNKYKHFLNGVILFVIFAVVGVYYTNDMSFEDSYAATIMCNKNAMKIDEAVCLQDMNDYIKQTMEIGVEYELVDKRDESTYRVAKLADGNVWLLDNLRIGGETEMLLTIDDTNTNPDNNGGNYVLPASGGAANSYIGSVIYTGDKDVVANEENQWSVGGYYNYCAASAGTYCDEDEEAEGDAMYDICPAGWRMPTGGNGGEYQTVVSMYNDAIDVLHLPLSGRYYDGASGRIGEDGYFWSSTNRDGRRMYYLNRAGNSLSPMGSYRRDRGYSMRCVAKDVKPVVNCNTSAKSIDEAICMQDMNAMVKESMEVDKKYLLIDSRDKEAYTVSKFQDDNVWLLDNLRLGGDEEMALTSDDTNTNPEINGGEFILPASGAWNDSFSEPAINVDRKNTIQDNQRGWKIGGYYNYCAASAGTYCNPEGENDLEYDICPARWRMPTGGNEGEYQIVTGMYDDLIDVLQLPLSGRFYGGESGRINEDGYFWSSTNRDNVRMYYLNRAGNTLSPTGSYRRDRGYSIRCVVNIKEEGNGGYYWKDDKNEYYLQDDNNLVLFIDWSPEAVLSVKVNGAELGGENYEVLNEGGTAIVLKKQYLDNLELGSYQITVGYSSGAMIDAEFVIKKKEVEPEKETEGSSQIEDEITVPNTGVISEEEERSKGSAMILSIIVGILVSFVSGFVLVGRALKK